jgi:1-deoxy-D-xylulose 5-phosphate reductoisomerase
VLAGDLFMQAVRDNNAELIPVDSEHSAIFQCLQSGKSGLSKIQLTYVNFRINIKSAISLKKSRANDNY